MTKRIPLNPDVLKWARETGGFSIDDIVEKMKRKLITSETVLSWENGSVSPTYSQLERLAYEIYKRPLALFFFPEPPQEETPKQSFRTFSDYEISQLEPRLRYLIRQARVMQLNLAELSDGASLSKRKILHDFNFKPNSSVKKMTYRVREYLGITLAMQNGWSNDDEAFKVWRNTLEANGVFVFKDTFNQREGKGSIESPFSGFCLYDINSPVIYVNNSKSKTRQIFTLFHELSHLLLGTGGVDTKLDYIGQLKGDSKKTEILCNQFASSFLVPDDDFDKRTSGISISETLIEKASKRYHVSREVILRKFLDRGRIDQKSYEKYVKTWKGMKRKKGPGGDHYKTKGAYLGENYIDLAFSRYYQKRISVDQLANYLGEKVKNIPALETQFFGRAGAR